MHGGIELSIYDWNKNYNDETLLIIDISVKVNA